MESQKRFSLNHQTTSTAVACFIVLTIIYLPCLSGSEFTIDDETLIDLPQLKASFSPTLLRTLFTPGLHIDFYPVRDIVYWFQIHALQADPLCLNMTVYRLFSLGLFSGILLFAGRILKRQTTHPWLASLYLGAFALLPYHSEMLMWASAQKDLLALLFGLMAMDQIDLWVRSGNGKGSLRWIAAILLFVMSFMSKASLVLLPPVLFLTFWTNPFKLSREKRRAAITYSLALSIISCTWALFQSRVYENINDMRFFYPLTYRVSASAAALGREIFGLLYPKLNSVDVENWGSWLQYNSHFVPVGFMAYAAYLIILAITFRRSNRVLTLSLLALGALYLPTSGLIFQHRNFYSTRYFEPTLVFTFLATGFFWSRVSTERIVKSIASLLVVSTAYSFFFSFQESEAWSSPRSVIEKSLSRHPDRLSLKAYLVTALNQENQWGRLSQQEVAHLNRLKMEIQNQCGLAEGSTPPILSDQRDDCIWSWMETLLNPKNRGTPAFQKASSYLQEVRARLLPERMKQLELRTEILEASYGMRQNLTVEPSALISNSGYEATPQGRARLIAALCLTGHPEEAKSLDLKYSAMSLIDTSDINEVMSSAGERSKMRSQQDLEKFRALQNCFHLSHP
ncbi:MAG: hypothetical protein ACJ763_17835 [Bdellovibrionia bacterium]